MIKIAICDDEKYVVDELIGEVQSFLELQNYKYSISSFCDGESLVYQIFEKNNTFDIIFLDIQMKNLNGIQTAKKIRNLDQRCSIVFVTALKDYVFDAFEVEATNYLVKPIDKTKLINILDNFLKKKQNSEKQFLIISKSNEVRKVDFDDIIYCEVCNHRVFIYEKTTFHEYNFKISELGKQLPNYFFKCHRSYIINLKFVERFYDGFVFLPTGEKVPVASRRQKEFLRALLNFGKSEVD